MKYDIVIVGAGSVGLEAALEFHNMGKDVKVIEMASREEATMKLWASSGSAAREFQAIIEAGTLNVEYDCKLAEITDSSLICENSVTGEKKEIPCDTALLAMGMRSRAAEAESMRHVCAETSIFVVGDAKKVGTIGTAVNESFRASLHI